MQMNIETDYAVRCILYMAQREGYSKAADISREMCISKEHCIKILRKLADAGLIVCLNADDQLFIVHSSSPST